MKTILFILFAGLLLILLTQWIQADFLFSTSVGGGAEKKAGEPDCFAGDIRLNTYNGRAQIVRQGALDAINTISQGWYISAGALAGSIEVEYFHIQLGEHDAAVNINGCSRMNYGNGSRSAEWRGTPPDTYSWNNFHARIKIFPRVFDEQAYWIAAENRWAETAVEAVKDVVLEGLVHIERYIKEQKVQPVRLLAAVDTGEN